MNSKLIEKAIQDGKKLAEEINSAKSEIQLDKLEGNIEQYANFLDNNFSYSNDSLPEDDRFCELSFYIYIALEEKGDHLEYYNEHPEVTSDGVVDFLDYLESMKWA
ncbi:hypothetical protein EUA79_02805 [TM7 phylum sp. oral taxon 351]|nr:hypothetical protein EUA79_02805 [TM7 phylum sp. oral taxon 351]